MKKILIVLVGVIMLAAACNNKPAPVIVPEPVIAPPPPQPVVTDPVLNLKDKQIITFAFDGSKSLDMWQESLDFAQKMQKAGKPIHFTYFISGVYLLTYKNKSLYQPPLDPAGTSKIGFADSNADLIQRINYINRAVAEGHEIGSHLNGHFDGTKWTTENWEQEFKQFESLLDNVNSNNQIDPAVAKLNITMKDVVGFRAPNLGRNDALWPILQSHDFIYDTSTVGRLGDWPKKNSNGLWVFPIPQIKYADTFHYLLSMDYNFYVHQTAGQDVYHKGDPDWQKALDDVYDSYINYFENNYKSTKAPVLIAHHFSKWNDGVYWEALKKFAETECGKTDVRCVSYKEVVDYLNAPR